MSIRILANQDIDREAWASFVLSHPVGNVFQSPQMYDFVLSVHKHEPIAMACVNDTGAIQGILMAVMQREHEGIIGQFSSRAIVWGGPLLLADPMAKEMLQALLHALIEQVGRKTVYLEFRNFFDLSEYIDVFCLCGFSFNEHLNFRVRTPDRETVWKNISSSRKRQIKKGLANGAEIKVAENIEQVAAFYEILCALYRTKVRKPLPDWSFFENFHLQGSKFGIYLLVTLKGKVIGGIMCPLSRDKVIYEWYVCGLDSDYPEHYPSVMATWAALDYAVANKIPCFDFMGAGTPEKDYGVREFKARFGGELQNHGRFVRVNKRILYLLGKMGLKLLGKTGSL